MEPQLNGSDAEAVDLVIRTLHALSRGEAAPLPPEAHDEVRMRINAASRVLGLLDSMPAPAPAADLVDRTLQRLAEMPTPDSTDDDEEPAADAVAAT